MPSRRRHRLTAPLTLALAQVQHSVELFAREVMPACKAAFP